MWSSGLANKNTLVYLHSMCTDQMMMKCSHTETTFFKNVWNIWSHEGAPHIYILPARDLQIAFVECMSWLQVSVNVPYSGLFRDWSCQEIDASTCRIPLMGDVDGEDRSVLTAGWNRSLDTCLEKCRNLSRGRSYGMFFLRNDGLKGETKMLLHPRNFYSIQCAHQ